VPNQVSRDVHLRGAIIRGARGELPLWAGSVRVTGALAPVVRCNCSICGTEGFLHLIVPPERFELLAGADDLTVYEFNTRTAKHQFCRHCGVHRFPARAEEIEVAETVTSAAKRNQDDADVDPHRASRICRDAGHAFARSGVDVQVEQ
jgi:hypothetical protein